VHTAEEVGCPGERRAAVDIVAFAHGWEVLEPTDPGTDLRLRPSTP
jgi:hypothetical protein